MWHGSRFLWAVNLKSKFINIILIILILIIFDISKNALMYTNLLVILAAVLNTASKYARSHEMLIIGRFISGMICGIFSGLKTTIERIKIVGKNNSDINKGLVPLYLNEISPLNLRGFTGALNALFIVRIHRMLIALF